MKTNSLTVMSAPGQGVVERAASWLASPSIWASTLLSLPVSHRMVVQSLVASLSFVAAICLLSLSEPAYGWVAFSGLLSLHCIAPLYHLIKED